MTDAYLCVFVIYNTAACQSDHVQRLQKTFSDKSFKVMHKDIVSCKKYITMSKFFTGAFFREEFKHEAKIHCLIDYQVENILSFRIFVSRVNDIVRL